MPQQINLSTPVLLAQKRYFSAGMMLGSLAIFLVLGGGLTAYGVWSLRAATGVLQTAIASQVPELARLRAALAQTKVDDGGGEQGMVQKLQAARQKLLEREMVLADLRQGLLAPGRGHSVRMQLVAQTIPPQAWVTGLRADEKHLEIKGFIQEPAQLNGWIARMASSPILSGLKLATVKVERSATGAMGAVPLWYFSLGSAAPATEGAP